MILTNSAFSIKKVNEPMVANTVGIEITWKKLIKVVLQV